MLHRGSTNVVAVALVSALITTIPVGGAQAADDGKYPTNWKGQWTRVVYRDVEVQGAFVQTKPWGRGQEAPLTEEYRKVHEASMEDQKNGGLGNYPTARCLPSGMPRMMTFGSQEYVITPETTYILLTGSDHLRRIFTDGRDWPKNPKPTYGGYSIGKWIDEDGDGRYDVLESETGDPDQAAAYVDRLQEVVANVAPPGPSAAYVSSRFCGTRPMLEPSFS